jgi:hypothetical protein
MTYRPNVSLPVAFRNARHNPRGTFASVANRGEEEKARKINKVIADGPDFLFGIFNNAERVYNIGGDHLYCDELVGSMPCNVRLDGRDGPPIRLEEGMVLRRPFSKFIIGWDYPLNQDDRRVPIRTPATRVTLYATYGPFMIEKPPKPMGAHPGFSSRFGNVANTTPKLFFADMMGEFSVFSPNPEELFGLGGATVVINNNDLATTLYLKYTDATDLAPALVVNQQNWYPLAPGQSISMIFESLIRRTVSSSIISIGGLYVATIAGTCSYSFLISRSPVFGPSGAYGGDISQPT